MRRSLECFILVLVFVLSACGGSDSGDDNGGGGNPPEPENVALDENGGVATANYDSENADIVNDGITADNPFWAGNANGDYMTVQFNSVYSLHGFILYTNATGNQYTRIQVSSDGEEYDDIGYFMGERRCDDRLSFGEDAEGRSRILCEFVGTIDASHIRVLITTDQASSVQIREIEALGT